MEHPDDTAAPITVSGVTTWLLRCACCAITFVVLLWIVAFVLTCMLLHGADTPAVHQQCAGFWDFMLVSILSPFLIPTAFCMLSCVTSLMQWHRFSGACMLVFSISSLYMTLTAATNHACVEALRETAPPIPWLILIGWFKAAAYGAGAISSLWGASVEHHPAPSQC